MDAHAKMTVKQLKETCKSLGLKNYSKLKKSELINLIKTPDVPRSRTIGKKQKEQLWNLYFSKMCRNGRCYVCDNELDILHFEAGHVVPFSQGGTDNIDNLRSICLQCNRGMGVENLNDYKRKISASLPDMTKIMKKNGQVIELIQEKYMLYGDLVFILKRDFNINIEYSSWNDDDHARYGHLSLNSDQIQIMKIKDFGFTVKPITVPGPQGSDQFTFNCIDIADIKKYYADHPISR